MARTRNEEAAFETERERRVVTFRTWASPDAKPTDDRDLGKRVRMLARTLFDIADHLTKGRRAAAADRAWLALGGPGGLRDLRGLLVTRPAIRATEAGGRVFTGNDEARPGVSELAAVIRSAIEALEEIQTPVDPALDAITRAWPMLPPAVQVRLLGIVQAETSPTNDDVALPMNRPSAFKHDPRPTHSDVIRRAAEALVSPDARIVGGFTVAELGKLIGSVPAVRRASVECRVNRPDGRAGIAWRITIDEAVALLRCIASSKSTRSIRGKAEAELRRLHYTFGTGMPEIR